MAWILIGVGIVLFVVGMIKKNQANKQYQEGNGATILLLGGFCVAAAGAVLTLAPF